MAAGDVEVRIVASPFTAASIDSDLTAMRTTAGANGKFLMCVAEGQVILAAITEA